MAEGIPTRKRKAAQIDDTTPNAERKGRNFHRKKQGVTKTNNAAVKALIRQNQVNSPLLKLAPEVREKILTYLVGDQVLHLHHSDSGIFKDDTWNKTKPASILYHVCQADTSKAHAHDQALNSVGDEAPAEDSAAHYVENSNKRHRFCRHLVAIKEERHNVHLSLKVLGTCRQLYEEANHLLWSTNTFTFNEPDAFELFFGSLNPAQKRHLTKLGFVAPTDVLEGLGPNWEKVFRPANLRMLQGVTVLNLWFEHGIGLRYFIKFDHYQRMKSRFWRNLEGFVQFRMLPLKQVFVTISDGVGNIGALERMNGDRKGRWTTGQKLQFTREWEEKLLDADPAATIEAEEDAAEVDAQKSSDHLWAEKQKTKQYDANRCQAEANDAAASLKEAKLGLARMTSSMASSIEELIKQRTAIARSTRLTAAAAMEKWEKFEADLHMGVEGEAAMRKTEREARKRRQVIIKARTTTSTKPTSS